MAICGWVVASGSGDSNFGIQKGASGRWHRGVVTASLASGRLHREEDGLGAWLVFCGFYF